MSDLDLLAFYKFCMLLSEDPHFEPNKDYYDNFIWFKNQDHIPHDALMTCSKCVSDECYQFAHRIIQVVSENS